MESPIILPPIPAHFPVPLISFLVHMMSISCLDSAVVFWLFSPYLLLLFKYTYYPIARETFSKIKSDQIPVIQYGTALIHPLNFSPSSKCSWDGDETKSLHMTKCMASYTFSPNAHQPHWIFFSSTSVSPSCKGPFYVVVSLPRRLTYLLPLYLG